MNTMKKLFSALLAVVMVLAMAFTAFAATETGTITVDNPLEGQTYTAYKIFDVTYNEGKDSFSYTIENTSKWYTMVSHYEGITLTKVGSSNKYIAKKSDSFSAAAFAAYLKTGLSGKEGTELTKMGDKAVAEGLDLGYYLVSSVNGALCNLTTTHPTATIHDKNDMPFDKTDDKADVQVGETVNYTITGKVPDTTGFAKYTYEIADTMSDGLTFQKDVKVTVGGNTLAASDGVYTLIQTEKGFTLAFDVMKMQGQVGNKIEVTYTAVVNEKAVAVVSKNKATLKYSNDPTDTSNTTTITEEETVYSAKIVIDKYESGNTGNKLAGAKFVLKNADGKYYNYENNKVTWVDTKGDAIEVTTDNNGAADFKGLKNGTYKLEETEAPAGYNMLTNDIEVTINGSDANNGTGLTVNVEVANSTGTTLPETGGIGTTIFYAVGGVLVIGAAVLLVTKKRMSTRR